MGNLKLVAQKAKFFFIMTRPYAYPIPILWGLTGALLASIPPLNWLKVGLATFLPLWAWVGAQLINDYQDIETDRLNYPYRPLPSGKVTLFETKMVIATNLVAIFLVTFLLNLKAGLIALGAAFLAFLYSKSKRLGILGGFTLAMLFVLIPIFSAYVSAQSIPLIVWFFSLSLFFYETGANIIGGYQDVAGDNVSDVKTLPVRVGFKQAAYIAALFLIVSTLISATPYILGGLNIGFLLIYFAFIFLMINIIQQFVRDPNPATGNQALKRIRIASIIHACAFLAYGADFFGVVLIMLLMIIFNLYFTTFFERQGYMV